MRFFTFFVYGFLVFTWTVEQSVFAQFEKEPDIPEVLVTVDSYSEPADPRPGEHVRIVVETKIHPDWKIYSIVPSKEEFAPIPTQIAVDSGNWKILGPFYETNPRKEPDPVLQLRLSYHKERVRFFQNLQISADATVQEYRQTGFILYQACSDRICLPPKRTEFTMALQLAEGEPRLPYLQANYAVNGKVAFIPANAIGNSEEMSLFAFLGLAVAAGLFALLTPCVLPMIPITVSFFTQQVVQSKAETLRLVGTFALGLIGTYTLLGMSVSVLLGATGVVQMASNPWLNLLIGVVFIVFALSLMGFFQLNLPSRFVTHLDHLSRNTKGIGGILLIGVAFTFTAFTCTIQFIGTLLLAASQGEWFLPILGMSVFASVFSAPFVLLGLFPAWIQKTKGLSGSWMEHLKILLGIVELGIAWKFLSNADLVWQWGIIDREVVLVIWAFLLLLSVFFLLGKLSIKGIRVQKIGRMPRVIAAAFLICAIYFGTGVIGGELAPLIESYLPPRIASTEADFEKVSDEAGLIWHDNLADALQIAQQQQKRVFIDFTGYTCINCRWMEKSIFAKTPILTEFRDQFILVQLYTDGGPQGEINQQLQIERFRTLALPFYVILNPQNQEIARHTGIMYSMDDFLRFLRRSS